MLKKFSASAKLYLLMFITAASLLGLGLYGISYLKKINENTRTLYADRVVCMHQLANCRYDYAGIILPCAEKVNDHLLSFDEAKAQIVNAEKNIDSNWYNYKLTYLTAEEALLVGKTELLKRQTDKSTKNLKAILSKKDNIALNQFIITNSFVGTAPIVKNLSRLMELQVRTADEVYNNNNGLYQQGTKNFLLIIFLALVLTLSLSFYIIKNIKNLIEDILDSKDTIKKSELKHRSLIERASDAIFVVDNKGYFTEVNESMCRVTGYSREELLRLNAIDIVDPEQQKADPVVYGSNIPNATYKRERRYIRKDRTIFDVEVNANLLFDENLLVIARDITDRKRMEAGLREAELKFRTAFEYSAIGIAIVSLEGKWLKVNISLCEMMGYSEQEFLEMSFFDITPPNDETLNVDIINEVLISEHGVAKIEKRYIGKNKTELWASVNIAVIRNEEGAPLYFVTQILDITERKKAESAQKLIIENEERLRAIFENVEGSTCLIDTNFNLITFNRVFLKTSSVLAGREPQIGDEIYHFLPPEEKKRRYEILNRVLEGKKEAIEVDYERNGEHLYFRTTFIPVTVDGKVTAISTYSIDYSERKRAELLVLKEKQLSETIVNSLPGVFYLQSITGEFLRWNKNFEAITGYSREEIKKFGAGELIAEEDRDKVRDTVKKVFAEGYAIVEARAKTKNGNEIHFLLTGIPIEYEDQLCLLGTGIDISSRVRAEEELRSSELKYKLLFESNPVPLSMIAKDDLSMIAVNEAAANLYGYTREEFLLLDASVVRLKEDLEDQKRHFLTEVVGPTDRGIVRHLKKDGTIIFVNRIVNDITFNGRAVRLVLSTDVTEKLEAEESLRESEARFRGAFENSGIGMGFVAPEGQWIRVNRSLHEMLGYTEQELLSLTFQQITHPEDLEKDLKLYYQTLRGEIDTYRIEKRYFHKEGNVIFIDLTVSIVRDSDKNPLYVVAQIENITEKVESQLKFQNLVENFIVGVYIHQNGKIVYVNPRLIEETGYAEKEIVDMPFEGFIYHDDLELVQKITAQREKGQLDTVRYEARFVKKDGQLVWFEIFGSRTVYRGAPALMGTMVNISERKEAEKEINRLSRLYHFTSRMNEFMLKSETQQDIYSNACEIAVNIGKFQMAWIGSFDDKNDRITPIAWSGHEDGFFNAINVSGTKVSASSIPSARAIQQKIHFYYNDIANDPEIPDSIKQEMVKRKYFSGVSLPIFIDGKIVAAMVLLMSEPFFFNDEEIRLLRGVTDNITYAQDKIRIRQQQNRSEANLRSMFDNTDISYLMLDVDYNIIALNQNMRTVYQDNARVTLKEGESLMESVIPERRQGLRELYGNVVKSKKPGTYESSFTNNGVTKHFALSVIPIIVADKVVGICLSSIDITAQKNALEKLKVVNENLEKHAKELAVSNAELEQFAFVASHDLQEPLRMITSFMAQLERRYSDVIDDRGKQYINFAVDGAKRMRQIILDLLDFSRVGRTENDLEEVDFNNLMNEVVALFGRQREENQARIIIENLPTIQTYKTPLRQVFQNLVGNSLKYHKIDEAPVINVSCVASKRYFQFSIKDNGIGIAPEYFDKIFIIFQRLHNKDEYSGTGMGLAITKKIIEGLGGKIWVESSEGVGSTFYFTLLKSNQL
jgi:PAS domain S-box-containing protein